MKKITYLDAQQIFDSRGIPTIECGLGLDNLAPSYFKIPSGASCGAKEALELRDGDKNKYLGKGVSQAILNITQEIKKNIISKKISSQEELDKILINLDGTENKSRLGANAILAVSGAYFHACAQTKNLLLYQLGESNSNYKLPMPMVNIINGGAHANNNLDIQEFMIVPAGAQNFSQGLQICAEVFYNLKKILAQKNMSTAVGDEGGFAPELNSNEQALEFILQAIEISNYQAGKDVLLAFDIAASELFEQNSKTYLLNKTKYDRASLLNYYQNLVSNYPICSIEDPFHEDDIIGFQEITKLLKDKTQIVGDDLFVTNTKIISQGIEKNYANAVLIKMNQIGTITETLQAIKLTQQANWNAIISHRSGETEDTTIADLAVLTNAGQIKTGSMSRSDRLAKYNRLLKIEKNLGSLAKFISPFENFKY